VFSLIKGFLKQPKTSRQHTIIAYHKKFTAATLLPFGVCSLKQINIKKPTIKKQRCILNKKFLNLNLAMLAQIHWQ
tara:strand:+ start:3250 stop:3477 length:228 start_codon:yes stop_codon:yes gene_type:complete